MHNRDAIFDLFPKHFLPSIDTDATEGLRFKNVLRGLQKIITDF